jgi:hypothetical protein
MKQIVITYKGIGMAEMPEKPDSQYDSYSGVVDTRTTRQLIAYDAYEKAKSKAIVHYFEDQERVKKYLPNDEWGRSPFDERYNPDKTMPIPPDFPKVVEIAQLKTISGNWVDAYGRTIPDCELDNPINEYRTVLRFVD